MCMCVTMDQTDLAAFWKESTIYDVRSEPEGEGSSVEKWKK